MRKCISFIDLLGTKFMATSDPRKYKEMISLLRNKLEDKTTELNEKQPKSVSCFMFSDCAYLEFVNSVTALDFYEGIRNQLFLNSCFFQASLIYGTLGNSSNIDSGDSTGFRSMLFFEGSSTINAYAEQINTKAIGLGISKDIAKKNKNRVITSCYLESPDAIAYSSYYDLKYKERIIEGVESSSCYELSKVFLSAYSEAYYGYKQSARYYIPPMKSLIDSLPFESFFSVKDKNNSLKLKLSDLSALIFGQQKGYENYSGDEYRTFHLIALNHMIDLIYEWCAKRDNREAEDPVYHVSRILHKINKGSKRKEIVRNLKNLNDVDPPILSFSNKRKLIKTLVYEF